MESKKFNCTECPRTHKSKSSAVNCCKKGEQKKQKFNRNKSGKNEC